MTYQNAYRDTLCPFTDSTPVLKTDKGILCYGHIVRTLDRAGLQSGDTVMVHSRLFTLGRPVETRDRFFLADAFVSALREILGPEGTLIVPTFTYSFCKNEIFDVKQSASTMGVFAERVRLLPDAVRSLQPIFSVAAVGRQARTLLHDIGKSSFGPDSIFDRLHGLKNAKFVHLGIEIYSLTYLHYVEQCKEVPYRYRKTFYGTIQNGEHRYQDACDHYVRDLNQNIMSCFHEAYESYLLQNGYPDGEPLGRSYIRVIREQDLFQTASERIDANENYFVTDLDRKPRFCLPAEDAHHALDASNAVR